MHNHNVSAFYFVLQQYFNKKKRMSKYKGALKPNSICKEQFKFLRTANFTLFELASPHRNAYHNAVANHLCVK